MTIAYWIMFCKALHIIGFVSWFAALFYLPRLFVYHVEAMDKPEPDRSVLLPQFELMEKRLYKIIMTPAMLITFCAGFAMIGMYVGQGGMAWWVANIWLHWKILLVFLLAGYHHYSKKVIKRLAKGEKVMTSTQFRLYNEISTIFLVAIVLLAVFRGSLNFWYSLVGLILFGVLLGMGVKWYKKIRDKADNA